MKPTDSLPENPAMKSRNQQKRLCDYCNNTTALLYCRADSAKLCFSCDREVHSANQLFTKHSRSQLCDVCDNSPASIFCETEQSVLCQNCDWETHNLSVSLVHDRRPIEGFTGCPTVTELVAIVGLEGLGKKALFSSEDDGKLTGLNQSDIDGLSELLVWETPTFTSLDDLIVSGELDHNFRAMDVPSLPNRNAACGQHKEDILSQLRELAKSENLSYDNEDAEPVVNFQLLATEWNMQHGNTFVGSQHEEDQISFPTCQAAGFKWIGDRDEPADQDFLPSLLQKYIREDSTISNKLIDISGSINQTNDVHESISQEPISNKTLPPFPRVAQHEFLNSQERDSAISRYKEKRKTRRYDKQIRYESRKVRAEGRTRIKGRFAKVDRGNTDTKTVD